MSSPTDFVSFYQQLGLGPDCSLAQLKNAYRRRVAELHPDRNPQRRGDDAAQLQELTAAYHAALSFERRHGRLPGARPPIEAVAATRQPRRPPDPSRRTGLRHIALAALAAGTLAWLAWNESGDDEPVATQAPMHERFVLLPSPAEPSRTPAGQRIELGMEAAAVRAIEGKPVMETTQRWDYGPSWIEFENGHVSDWYSSRLRPLKVSGKRPAR